MADRSRSPRKDGSLQGTSRQGQAATRRTAFVTLATHDYKQGALVLTAGLRSRLPDTIDVIVFSDAELSLVPGVQLRRLSSLPDIPVPAFAGEPLMPNFKFCWKKLGLWSLEEYEVIVYMDADILILGNILSILESTPPLGMLAAVPACECWRSETCNYTAPDLYGDSAFYFNAGVLVLRPNQSDFDDMTAWMQSRAMQTRSPSSVSDSEMPFAEQDFLNIFFEKKICRLSPVFNALQHALKNPKHQALNESNCIALHYVMGKPWAPTKLEEDFVDLHNLWRRSFQEFSRQAFLRPSWDLCRVDPKLSLFLVKDYISAETEAALVASIYGESLESRWVTLSSRRLLCLGGVPHPDGAICEALPCSIEDIGRKVLAAGGLSGSPNQCLINSYLPGQGIDAHSDGPRFESEVAILTLEGPALMYFGLVEKKAYTSQVIQSTAFCSWQPQVEEHCRHANLGLWGWIFRLKHSVLVGSQGPRDLLYLDKNADVGVSWRKAGPFERFSEVAGNESYLVKTPLQRVSATRDLGMEGDNSIVGAKHSTATVQKTSKPGIGKKTSLISDPQSSEVHHLRKTNSFEGNGSDSGDELTMITPAPSRNAKHPEDDTTADSSMATVAEEPIPEAQGDREAETKAEAAAMPSLEDKQTGERHQEEVDSGAAAEPPTAEATGGQEAEAEAAATPSLEDKQTGERHQEEVDSGASAAEPPTAEAPGGQDVETKAEAAAMPSLEDKQTGERHQEEVDSGASAAEPPTAEAPGGQDVETKAEAAAMPSLEDKQTGERHQEEVDSGASAAEPPTAEAPGGQDVETKAEAAAMPSLEDKQTGERHQEEVDSGASAAEPPTAEAPGGQDVETKAEAAATPSLEDNQTGERHQEEVDSGASAAEPPTAEATGGQEAEAKAEAAATPSLEDKLTEDGHQEEVDSGTAAAEPPSVGS
eukprot:Skav203637  [mRNA]  locus=scaffold1120:158345:177318:+ [translate_table: standard]